MQNAAARNMALGQLMTNEVMEPRLLEALITVPRERYVPPQLAGAAYVDDELPLGQGRFLMAPLPFARLLALAEIKPDDRVLDIGCAYGYSTAVLAKLAREVTGCEANADMAAAAKRNLETLGVKNAHVARVDDLAQGYPGDGPYDVILVEGAMATVPAALLRLLKDGGRLVAVERQGVRPDAPGVPGGLGRLVMFLHRDGAVLRKSGREANVPVLPGFEQKPGFIF